MKTISQVAAAAALAGSAVAQFNGNYPSCLQNCINQYSNSNTNFNSICQNQAGSIANCVSSTSCSDSDKNNFYNTFAQNCASSGVSLSNIAPYNSRYTTSNGFTSLLVATVTAPAGFNGFGGGGNGWAWPTSGSLASAYSSYTSAHPNGPSSGDWASFTSKYSLTNGPWGGATPTGNWGNWGSWATGSSGSGPFGGRGGGMGPFGFGMGSGGWNPGNGGPFGGNWGNWASTGSWTAGPWTSWWNGNQCPASTWSGWTSGSWSTSAPWTTWTGCTATPTATSVFTTTVNGIATVSSTYQYRVAQAVALSTDSSGAIVTTSRAAAPTGKVVAGGAAVAGLVGLIAVL